MNPTILELILTLLAEFANELPAAIQAVHASSNGAGKTAAGLEAATTLVTHLAAIQPTV